MAIAVHDLGPDPETMTVREACKVLGISMSHAYEQRAQHGELAPGVPFIQIGTTYRLPRAKVIAWARGDWAPGQSWPAAGEAD